MTRYEILANDLSNMLHEQLRNYELKVQLCLCDYSEYVIKCSLVSAIDNLLDNEWLNEEHIVILINKSLEDLYNFYGDKFDIKANEVYFDCVEAFCLEALEAKED